jgi:hypothetical protein
VRKVEKITTVVSFPETIVWLLLFDIKHVDIGIISGVEEVFIIGC